MPDRILVAKGILLIALIIYAAWHDYKTHTVQNRVCLLLIVIGAIGMELDNVLGIELSVPFFIAACIDEAKIGGGDVKFIAASAFAIGARASILAFMIILVVLAAMYKVKYIVYKLFGRKAKAEKQIALIPVFATGLIPMAVLKYIVCIL